MTNVQPWQTYIAAALIGTIGCGSTSETTGPAPAAAPEATSGGGESVVLDAVAAAPSVYSVMHEDERGQDAGSEEHEVTPVGRPSGRG